MRSVHRHNFLPLLALLLLTSCLLEALGTENSGYSGPLFDAHAHITMIQPLRSNRVLLGPAGPEEGPRFFQNFSSLLQNAGVAGAFLFGPSFATTREQKDHPDFVFPFAVAPVDPFKRQLQFDENTIPFLERQLQTGIMRGIGEIPMRHRLIYHDNYQGYPADGPIALKIYDLAAKHKVPLNLHVEHEFSAELERALDHNRDVTIIWAHMGDGPATLVRQVMHQHPNLCADISTRNPWMKKIFPLEEQSLTNESGKLKEEWRNLFEEFPDRILFGLDINSNERLQILEKLVSYYRSILGELKPTTAEKIAYKNARGLLQRQSSNPAQQPVKSSAPEGKQNEVGSTPADTNKRIELNLLGKTDTAAGESRRNENVQFNLVDNNALKELNVRLGTTATIFQEFSPSKNYFGAEFGNLPVGVLTLPGTPRRGNYGSLYVAHLNSIFSARSFFQVGDVKPARENHYGLTLGTSIARNTQLFIEGGQEKLRGSVNGNVLVPKPDERTPLASDPATRALVTRYLAAYPAELPNRTDINPRALNTNSPQVINNNNAEIRLDHSARNNNRFALQYVFTSQNVNAFQLVAGQNPDTDTKSHKARISWSRQFSPTTVMDFSLGFDRVRSLLRPEENAVGPMVQISGLETLGPLGSIPIDRAQNLFRYAGQVRRVSGPHSWSAGFGIVRRQLNGKETDAHRGFFAFSSDFGRDAIANFRLGTPTQHIIAIGNIHRGFRNWDIQLFASDNWRATPNFTLQYGLRYQPALRPVEVNGLNRIPYDSDRNNLAPMFGIAYRLPQRWGNVRAAYGLHYGEIFPVTFQQVRFSPPGSVKYVVTAPNLLDPLHGLTQEGLPPTIRGNLYLLDPGLATPYAHQYNLSWEPDWSQAWKLQLGYVGSRSQKLLVMWYLNRAHPVSGIEQSTATINLRRANPEHADIRWVLNGSRGYFDAARVSLVLRRWHGLSVDTSYWFSKAIDLGSSHTNTAYDQDSRLARSQSEFETHRDMKGLSSFDQTQAFLWRSSVEVPSLASSGRLRKLTGDWNFSVVVLIKTGLPFNIASGSDGPGYGNVDGNGSDRPNLVEPSILGRTIDNPDTSKFLLPRNAFAFMGPADDRGNLGHNVFRKGPIRNVNAALSRTWAIHRERRLTFRAESVNLLNTPQFAEPGFELTNTNFGQITNTLNDGRTFRFQMQFGW